MQIALHTRLATTETPGRLVLGKQVFWVSKHLKVGRKKKGGGEGKGLISQANCAEDQQSASPAAAATQCVNVGRQDGS
jgi:hypothetical protein